MVAKCCHLTLSCHRNVQIQDLQQKICDADQGEPPACVVMCHDSCGGSLSTVLSVD